MQKKSNNALSNTVLILFLFAGGFILGLDMAAYTGDISNLAHKLIFYSAVILTFLFALLLHTFIHEAGHLVFGLLSGYRFSSFRIFSLMLLNDDGHLTFKKLKIAGTAGQCLMAPPETDTPENVPFVLYNLGGALMNLIASALFILLYIICKDVPYLSSFFLLLALGGALFAITNGLPRKNATVCNDGANIEAIKSSPAARRAFWMQLKVNAEGARGVRLRDMPDSWFIPPKNEELCEQITCAASVIAVDRLMDLKDFEKACEVARPLLSDGVPVLGLHRALIVCNLIYIALLEHRFSDCDALMTKEQKKLMELLKDLPPVIRTQYAYSLLCKKDTEESDRILAQFEKCAKSYPYSVDIESERELIDLAKDRFTK